ncbi:MAG TPA: hypothetical protein VKP88_01235, partial [Candidatus Paceibacterota bacterium]|nr:hypothetical protein [Candidatus Paceibacterota bacterium]
MSAPAIPIIGVIFTSIITCFFSGIAFIEIFKDADNIYTAYSYIGNGSVGDLSGEDIGCPNFSDCDLRTATLTTNELIADHAIIDDINIHVNWSTYSNTTINDLLEDACIETPFVVCPNTTVYRDGGVLTIADPLGLGLRSDEIILDASVINSVYGDVCFHNEFICPIDANGTEIYASATYTTELFAEELFVDNRATIPRLNTTMINNNMLYAQQIFTYSQTVTNDIDVGGDTQLSGATCIGIVNASASDPCERCFLYVDPSTGVACINSLTVNNGTLPDGTTAPTTTAPTTTLPLTTVTTTTPSITTTTEATTTPEPTTTLAPTTTTPAPTTTVAPIYNCTSFECIEAHFVDLYVYSAINASGAATRLGSAEVVGLTNTGSLGVEGHTKTDSLDVVALAEVDALEAASSLWTGGTLWVNNYACINRFDGYSGPSERQCQIYVDEVSAENAGAITDMRTYLNSPVEITHFDAYYTQPMYTPLLEVAWDKQRLSPTTNVA